MSFNQSFPIDRQIVASSEPINRDFRLDPSQYNERGERITRHLKQLGVPLVKIKDSNEFKEVYLPNRFTRIYLDGKEGAPMLGTSTMLLSRLHVESRIRIEGEQTDSPLWIKPGDILISRSGTVGTSVLCGESYSKYVASDDCLRLRVGKNFRGFLAAYLQSPIGQTLLIRDGHGKVIRHLKERDIYNFKYPQIAADEFEAINDIVNRATDYVDDARKSLDDAERELCNILGTPNNGTRSDKWINKSHKNFLRSSNILSNVRLDPHFYDPDLVNLQNFIESNFKKSYLGAIADIWMPQRFSRPHAAEGFGTPLYSSGKIMRAYKIPSSFVSRRAERYLNQCLINSGTILICRSGAFGGIMGRATFASPAMDNWAVSEHMIRCKVKDPEFLPEYIFAFLGSITYGYPLITRYRHGKDVPELDPKELESIPIPKLSKDEQELIAQYIKVAFSKFDKFNQLEDEAQARLKRALKWIEA